MAVVVPVAVQGLHIAALAGEVSQRKAQAMRIAEKVLNETIVTGQWNSEFARAAPSRRGRSNTGAVRNEPWSALAGIAAMNTSNGVNQGVVNGTTLHQLTVDVSFPAQSQTYAVHLSTADQFLQQVTIANLPPAQ